MGEIPSTMDIIMEKSKGLTMTDSEKKALREKEMGVKVRGLIQRFIDGVFDVEKIRDELKALAEKGDVEEINRLIQAEVLERIEPGQENDRLLELLEQVSGKDSSSIKKVLGEFNERMDREKEVRQGDLREALRKKGISGSALLPNLMADSRWKSFLPQAKDGLKEELRSLVNKHSF